MVVQFLRAYDRAFMNASRMALGGLAAGLLLLGSGFALAHGVLGPEYAAAFASHRVHPVARGILLENIAIRLGYGLLTAFLYAALRPRFGAGPRTAVVAGLFVWIAAYLPRLIELHDFGILYGWRLAVSLPWSLAEIL